MRKRMNFFSGIVLCLIPLAMPVAAQNASLVGTVRDPQQSVIPNTNVTLTNLETGVSLSTKTDVLGNYEFPFVKPGKYSLKAEQKGFETFVQAQFTLAVDERSRVDAMMRVGEATTLITVEESVSGIQTESSNLGEVVTNKRIVEMPLNGRFFLDLALLSTGTVVPSTNNRTFLAVPSGIGMTGINASGTREDSTNYLVDGINLSDMVQNQITFQPNIDMIQEFKVVTNAFNAEQGRNAGIVITAVSKSGTNGFHGTGYEFLRNQRFDAKNFFDPPGPIIPFNRDIYGYSIGGPIRKNRTFFFTSYEGREGHEVASLKTPVPTAAQRATVTNPVIQKLLTLIPAATDPTGAFFVGPTPRNRHLNQFTGRIDHNFSANDFLFGSFISNRDSRTEPTLQNNNLPGFGDYRPAKRELLSLGYTHVFSPVVTNELRAGVNRVLISFVQNDQDSPATFGITSPSAVFPQIIVGGGGAGGPEFGGISGFPQGRGDTTFHYSDTLGWIHGKHSLKFGAEFRRFRNNNTNGGTGGIINFASLATFLAGTVSSATETALPATPGLRVNALGVFAQDDYKVTAKLTLNLGLRWEYNGVPSEIHNRLGVYDFSLNKVIAVGTGGVDRPYNQQYTNFGPRIGFAYDPMGKGKTVIRGGTGIYYDQPVTNIVTPLDNNPPFSFQVNNTSNINLASPFAVPPGGSAAIQAIDPNFKSGTVFSYNFNIQHEEFGTVFQAGYVGSQGRHLRLTGDYNQGINGVRPIPGFTSITVQESVSNSNYNGLWISANKRLAKGLTFNSSFTFSKSIDNNSVGSSNPQIQNFYNIAAERALSDFDARRRFVLSGTYLLPFRAEQGFLKRVVEGWSMSPIVNLQSGNPFSPIIAATDTAGSLEAFNRPNLVPGAVLAVANPSPAQWFNTAAFTRQATGFGSAGRNVLTAPGFEDIDFAIAKNTSIREGISLQFRAEAFNLFNHPNFGQPANSITSATFGQITSTRTARGDLGSSRQLQLGLKLIF
jgi:Carboxypeptidase regulatory-like domain/TonB dependent receptor